MVTLRRANYALNISLHVLILFSFLTIFFFSYISHLEQKSVDDALTNAINEQMGQVLDYVNKFAPSGTVDWKVLNSVAEKIQADAIGEFPEVKANHRKLLIIGICMIGGLFVLFSSLSVYFGVYKRLQIGWKRILLENLIVFACVGIIEYLFFTKVAVQYVPVTPDVLTKTILDRIKYRFYQYIEKNK